MEGKLGDAMFDEDDIFCPPSFDVQIYYDESMPPIYDDYIDESGFGEVMTLFNDEFIILDEASIDYENKVAIYDDYGDYIYMLYLIMITMKLVIMILIFTLMIVILLSLLPLLSMRRNLLMWRVISFLCLCTMKRMLYMIVILLNSFMMLLKIIMRRNICL